MPHKESIRHLMHSDVLLLIVDESKESEDIVPGKVYEYIGVLKPVFANTPEHSAIADLIDETQAGKYAHQSDIEMIKEIFMEFFTAWQNGSPLFSPKIAEIRKYERKRTTWALADLLWDFFDSDPFDDDDDDDYEYEDDEEDENEEEEE